MLIIASPRREEVSGQIRSIVPRTTNVTLIGHLRSLFCYKLLLVVAITMMNGTISLVSQVETGLASSIIIAIKQLKEIIIRNPFRKVLFSVSHPQTCTSAFDDAVNRSGVEVLSIDLLLELLFLF